MQILGNLRVDTLMLEVLLLCTALLRPTFVELTLCHKFLIREYEHLLVLVHTSTLTSMIHPLSIDWRWKSRGGASGAELDAHLGGRTACLTSRTSLCTVALLYTPHAWVGRGGAMTGDWAAIRPGVCTRRDTRRFRNHANLGERATDFWFSTSSLPLVFAGGLCRKEA